jgi:FkbM family methyltransferase
MLSLVGRRVASLRRDVETLGAGPAAVFALQWARSRLGPAKEPFTLHSKEVRYPLLCRPGTSDMDVFGHIFRVREYSCLDPIAVDEVELVIDCGANVGYSSAYFLSRFPRAKVIAVEPDSGNFAMLQENVRPYGDRCRTVKTALWSHPTGLVMSEEKFGDGREWARTVRAVRPGEDPAMMATDIGSLLASSGCERISLLKVDIEGAESVVFESNYEPWLAKVSNLVIELHGEAATSIVKRAIAKHDFETSSCGELFVCRRRSAA